jgi:hypothetical protein
MDPKSENIHFSINFLNNENETITNDYNDIININENNENNENNELNFSGILTENNDDYIVFNYLNYSNNYTLKELILICEFYNIAKELKSKKANKETIINAIHIYENDNSNYETVVKRHNFWFYMKELKNDKFMRKYVIW